MGKIIKKEEFEEMKNLPGKVRGVTLKGYQDYILQKEGEEAWEELEAELKNWGYPKKINAMAFYPLCYQALIIETIKRIFDYSKEDFQKMGKFSSKTSLIIKLFMKYFFSRKKIIGQASKAWNKSYTVGKFEVKEYNEKDRYIVFRIMDFKVHPMQCQILIGYFSSVLQMIGGDPARGEETKCAFKGDNYHEFVMRW